MKNAICLMLTLSPLYLLAQIQSACTLPQSIISSYQKDVKALAVELMATSNTSDVDSISIITTYENDVWKGLATVINKGNLNYVDTIFNKACIKRRFNYTSGLSIRYNPDAAWIQTWMADKETINNLEVSDLLSCYSYNVNFTNSIQRVYLRFNEILNLEPLIDLLSEVDDFKSVDFSSLYGDGSDIFVSQSDSILTINFKLGWGDCPSGCTHRRYYVFKVDICSCTLLNEFVSGSPNNNHNLNFSNCNTFNIDENKKQ